MNTDPNSEFVIANGTLRHISAVSYTWKPCVTHAYVSFANKVKGGEKIRSPFDETVTNHVSSKPDLESMEQNRNKDLGVLVDIQSTLDVLDVVHRCIQLK